MEGWGYMGYIYRKEAVVKTSPDTMLLVNQASNELDLTIGKNYDLHLEIEGFEVHGVTFANSFPLYGKGRWDIQLGIAAELLYGTEVQDGYVNGDAAALSENDYDFTFNSNYLYTENYLYDLDVAGTNLIWVHNAYFLYLLNIMRCPCLLWQMISSVSYIGRIYLIVM